MAVDSERDLIFVPPGSASPDYHGGLRPGDNKWANSLVARHAKTGKITWGLQLAHHDLWDYDTASPPLLATLRHGGESVPVVIQNNKTGFLFVLHRDTGKPVFPVEERRVPPSNVPGEAASPTQPFPRGLRLHSLCNTSRPMMRGVRHPPIETRAASGSVGCAMRASSRRPACRARRACPGISAA